MFSVVIPLYNKSEYIQKSISSVLSQSLEDFELIIIDDGSTDDGPQKVNGFSDSRIRMITQKNAGVSTARNVGVDHSKNQHIAFLDADDWWHPEFLYEMKQLIIDYSDAAIYGCNYYYVKNGKNIVEYKGLETGFKAGYINYFHTYSKTYCVPFNCSFVVVSKDVFIETGGFNLLLKFGEDLDLWIRMALKHKVAYLNKPLSYSNQDVLVETRALGFNKLYSKEHHCIFNFDYLKLEEEKNKELKNLLDGLRLRSFINYHLQGKYKNEIDLLLNSINFNAHPFIFRFIYKYPKIVVKLYYFLKTLASKIKQKVIKN